jgi:hypothetical protein
LVMVKFEINTYPAKVIVEYIPIITTSTTTPSFPDSSIIVNN